MDSLPHRDASPRAPETCEGSRPLPPRGPHSTAPSARRRRGFVALTALPLVCCAASTIHAQTSPQAAVAACRAAAEQAQDYDPIRFECDWKAVRSAAPRGALVGRFAYQRNGHTGGITILQGREGSALVAVHTINQRTADSCTLQLEGTASVAELVLSQQGASTCTLRITPSGRALISVSASSDCLKFCSGDAALDGTYWNIGR